MGSQSAKSPVQKGTTQDSKPEDAVLVFGATGKLGRLVVKEVILSRPPTLETNSVQIWLDCYMLWVFLTAPALISVLVPQVMLAAVSAQTRHAIVVEGDLSN